MTDRHSSTAHAAYHDLLRTLLDEAVSDIRGTPTRVERSGKVYWYDSYRVGSDVRKTYIGDDNEALRGRLAQLKTLRTEKEARRQHRMRLIRILRAEGFLGVDARTLHHMNYLIAEPIKAAVTYRNGVLVQIP